MRAFLVLYILLDAHMSSGTAGFWMVVFIGAVAAWYVDLLIRIVRDIALVRFCVTHTVVELPGKNIELNELQTIMPSHVREYLKLVNTVPVVPLRVMKVPGEAAVQTYMNAPITVLHAIVNQRDRSKVSDSSFWTWISPFAMKASSTVYTLVDNMTHPSEPLVGRFTRYLSPYATSDVKPPDLPTDGHVHVTVTCGITCVGIVLYSTSGTHTLYLPPYATLPSGPIFTELPIYLFEECTICYDRVNDTILVPCGHTSTCGVCTRSLRDSLCPICRSQFSACVSVPVLPRSRPPTPAHVDYTIV
jgi:hypothetical protein